MNLLKKIQIWRSILFYSPIFFMHLIIQKIFCKNYPKDKNDIIIRVGSIRFPIYLYNYNSNKLKTYLHGLYNQSYEPFTRHLIEKIVKPGDVFYDVGANLGYFSAVAANVVGPSGEIYCFDVDPRCVNNLEKFKSINADYKIYPKNIAVGSKNEHIKLELSEVHTWNTIKPSNMTNKSGCFHDLEMTTLSSFIISNNLQLPKLIKIDVEGAEYDVLTGLSVLLKQNKNKPYIIMEIDHCENNVLRIYKIVDDLGYKVKSTVPPFKLLSIEDITIMTNVLLEPIVK